MSVAFRLKGFDELFDSIPTSKYIINDYDITNIDTKEMIDDLLMTNLVNEDLSMIPSCDCGELKGYTYIGSTCGRCNTAVKSILDEDIDFKVWVRRPIGVERMISPVFLYFLIDRYRIGRPKFSLVEYITQTNFRFKNKRTTNLEGLDKLHLLMKNHGLTRGYNSFVENFDKFIEILEMNFCTTGRKADKEEFVAWARSKFEDQLSNVVPILNNRFFILDHSDGIKYADKDMNRMLNAINRMAGIDIRELTQHNRENRTASFLSTMARFYDNYLKEKVYRKHSLVRQQITRTRSHFTLRAVISSRVGRHRADELALPWSASTSLFHIHLISGLMKRGFQFKDAQDHINEHVNKYSPVIDEIFKELISGTSEFGFPNITNRNPSLGRGSLPYTGITSIKTDPRDKTVSISNQLSPITNLDFDGDMLHFTLVFTKEAINALDPFAIRHNVLGLNSPNEFSSSTGFAKSDIGTMSNWLDCEKL